MQDFIHRKNLENWRKLPAEATDETMRARLSQLISDEEAPERQPSHERKVR